METQPDSTFETEEGIIVSVGAIRAPNSLSALQLALGGIMSDDLIIEEPIVAALEIPPLQFKNVRYEYALAYAPLHIKTLQGVLGFGYRHNTADKLLLEVSNSLRVHSIAHFEDAVSLTDKFLAFVRNKTIPSPQELYTNQFAVITTDLTKHLDMAGRSSFSETDQHFIMNEAAIQYAAHELVSRVTKRQQHLYTFDKIRAGSR